MADDQKKVDGHRRAIRDHIDKYKSYPAKQDKDYALKTIRRVQGEISDIRAKNSRIGSSWEDNWRP
jgi:hypothetical protein